MVQPDVLKAYVKRNEESLDAILKEIGPNLALQCTQMQNLQFVKEISRQFNIKYPVFLSVHRFFEKMKLTSKQAKGIKEIQAKGQELGSTTERSGMTRQQSATIPNCEGGLDSSADS